MSPKSILGWLLFLVLISPFVAYGAGQFIPFYDGFIVTSGSMEPEIQTGAVLFTYRTSAENIRVGDTITFQKEDTFTTHEVIEKNTDPISFRTQGTANNSPDPGTVSEDELAGKKLFSVPYLGYLISWAGSRNGIALFIIVPGAILVLMELRSIITELRENT
jgi:signal peptidase